MIFLPFRYRRTSLPIEVGFQTTASNWEEVHKRRHLQWQSGDGIEQIAASEGVTYNAVKHSLLWCEARLSHAEVLAAHQTRLRLQAFGRLSTRYLDELESLMSDPNPVIRARALEAFRRTVGLEMSGGVNVNVSQRTTVSNGHPSSFEEVMEHVRAKTYSRAPRAKRRVCSSGPPDPGWFVVPPILYEDPMTGEGRSGCRLA